MATKKTDSNNTTNKPELKGNQSAEDRPTNYQVKGKGKNARIEEL
jgi:hypothetical protein